MEKLYFVSLGKAGVAADEADTFARLLTHDDASLRMETAKGLVRMVGAEKAAALATWLREVQL